MPNTAVKSVRVAAGVVIRDGRVLLTRRHRDAHQGGLWEFPGGKIEAGETAREALCRELTEELGIEVVDAAPLLDVEHDYGDKQVALEFWQVGGFRGEPVAREGQAMEWCPVTHLREKSFPAANVAVVDRLLELFGVV